MLAALLCAGLALPHPRSSDAHTRHSIPPMQSRNTIGALLEREGMTIGAELGVHAGLFAAKTLAAWKSAREYHLVDLWAPLANYNDSSAMQSKKDGQIIFRAAMQRLAPWKSQLRVCRNFTLVCAEQVEDGYFDYVYVDARHDYKGVTDDLLAWWSKVRVGGIFAGHDYSTADNPELASHGQDWSLNYDGTRNPRAVKGAVDDFAASIGRELTLTTADGSLPSWLIRK